MRRNFADRETLIVYLREQFPEATAVSDEIPDTRGGRKAAEAQLAMIDPEAYEGSRNHLDGAVTHLSPYLRHGVLALAEVRDRVSVLTKPAPKPSKLVQELGWRDYFQRVFEQIGWGIWQDREGYKTGFTAADYGDELPTDIAEGKTGLACIDAFGHMLVKTGYLHNHARMWLAGYIVHWRRVKWQVGARWFLSHLLDGDPASNNLSWQWVASTYSHKPYYFNRENVERFTNGRYCRDCPLLGRCDFEGSYAELGQQLFPNKPVEPTQLGRRRKGKRRKRWHQ